MSFDLEPPRRIGSGLAGCLLAGLTVIYLFWCGAGTGVGGFAAAEVTSELLDGSVPGGGDLEGLIVERIFLGPFAALGSYWSFLTVPLFGFSTRRDPGSLEGNRRWPLRGGNRAGDPDRSS